MQRPEILREAQFCFFEAMRHGYANGAEAETIPEQPGWKGYLWEQGAWQVSDGYYVHPDSGKSCGNTYIRWDGKLVWMMSYAGWYDQAVSACLKAALFHNYLAETFHGGRGPSQLVHQGYTYHNLVYGGASSNFERFSAYEHISSQPDPKGDIIQHGYHEIIGMALI